MAHVLGIDFGGTKIMGGVIDTATGEVLSDAKKRTHAERGADEVMKRLLAVANEALGAKKTHEEVSCVGVGVAGQVAADGKQLVRAPNLPEGLAGDTIARHLEGELHLPVRLFNDVSSAAAGEAAHGAGKGHPDFVCIFVGTGIGGAIYREGRPYRGASNTAGELGHMVVSYDGRICGCGGRGHLEAYASRTAVVRTILGALRQGRTSSLSDLAPDPNPDAPRDSQIRSRAIAQAVTDGDAVTIELISDAARYMGAGLVSVINFYNPPRVILGGGMVDVVDLYFDLAKTLALEDALQVPRVGVQIVKAALGDFSGIVGAAVLAAG